MEAAPIQHSAFSLPLACVSSLAATLADDHEINVHSTRQVANGRRALHRYLWGQDGVPSQRQPDVVVTNIPSDAMFEANDDPRSPIRLFLESTAIGLNYLKQRGRKDGLLEYRAFHMIGLSGGGWTTTVYAALDPRIRCSFPVAGSIPLCLRSGRSIGDREQYEAPFYQLARYPDLYVLGAHGDGRNQVQILVRRDDCCFGEA